MDWRVFRAIAMLLLIGAFITFSSHTTVAAINVPDDLQIGPYVNRIVFFVEDNQDQTILGLQAGEFEMQLGFVDPVHLPTLDAGPDIDIFSALRNGYGHFTIDCHDYPLNISAFRRAFAFAFDKTRITSEIKDGFSQEHDSLLPYVSGWCIEDELDWHYYTAQPDIGNDILDAAGFAINESSGWRKAPDGSPFSVLIEYPSTSPEIAGGTAQIGVDALHSLNVDAESRAVDFNEYTCRCDGTKDFDMLYEIKDFPDTEPLWLVNEFLSDNTARFINQTLDSYRDQFLYSTDPQEVRDAVSEIQKILHYNVPWLVTYEDTYMQMYRNDLFTGHVPDLVRYISGPWTMRNIYPLDGYSHIPTIAMPRMVDTFNIFLVEPDSLTNYLLDNMYSSLYVRGPNQNPIGDLASSLVTETHDDNHAVPEGHTRFTIETIKNATWSDGTPLTAEDVAFTFTYILESGVYGNPWASQLVDLQSAVALGPYTLRLEFNTESYWHFNNFAFVKIIPKHIFNNEDGIGYANWILWNPVFDPEAPLVTSGPFIFTDLGEGYDTFRHIDLPFYELTQNPFYHWNPKYTGTFIKPLDDITYFVGSVGNTIEWESTLSENASYTLLRDSEFVESGRWEEGTLVHSIDGLEIGSYEYTLEVVFDGGYTETSSVHVHVIADFESTPSVPESTLHVIPIVITVASIQVILWVAYVAGKDYKRWRVTRNSAPEETPVDWFSEIFGPDCQTN